MSEELTPWLNEQEMQVWRRWLRVQTELSAALGRAMHSDSALSMQDFETLVRLSEADDGRLRISVLAEQMHWERSRLSHHLRRMSGRGLVHKEECAEDGRGAFVVITAAGQEALDRAAPGGDQRGPPGAGPVPQRGAGAGRALRDPGCASGRAGRELRLTPARPGPRPGRW